MGMKPGDLLKLLAARGFKHSRAMGQNFLVDPGLLGAIADTAEVGPTDHVVEVGTGAGTLTRVLSERGARVTTFELDKKIGAVAQEFLGERPNVKFVSGDALQGEHGLHPALEAALRAAGEVGASAKVVSNFPYSIVTPLVMRLLERAGVDRAFPLACIAGMVQREAAQRLTAESISKEYGAPTVLARALADVKVARTVSRRAFVPPPKVESSVILVTPRAPGRFTPERWRGITALVRAAFQQRRKTIRNAIVNVLALDPAVADRALALASVDPGARVEALSVDVLVALGDAIAPSLPD